MRLKTVLNITAFLFLLFILFIIFSANVGLKLPFFKVKNMLPMGDKVAHFLLVGTLTFFVNLWLNIRQVEWKGYHFLLGSLLVFGFFTLEEFSQIFLARRNFDLLDLSANYLGIFLFGHLAWWLCKRYDLLNLRVF